jgi:hypothetical protein
MVGPADNRTFARNLRTRRLAVPPATAAPQKILGFRTIGKRSGLDRAILTSRERCCITMLDTPSKQMGSPSHGLDPSPCRHPCRRRGNNGCQASATRFAFSSVRRPRPPARRVVSSDDPTPIGAGCADILSAEAGKRPISAPSHQTPRDIARNEETSRAAGRLEQVA